MVNWDSNLKNCGGVYIIRDTVFAGKKDQPQGGGV